MAEFIQSSFDGGLNLLRNGTKINDDQYIYLLNGRPRNGGFRPINKPLELTDAPAGLKQGLYAIGDILVLFVSGRAYFKIADATTWTLISTFGMPATIDRIYACAVPVSLMNNPRVATSNTDINAGAKKANTSIYNTPQGLVCQDGFTQPQIIFSDGTSRYLQTYAQWAKAGAAYPTAQEYVPIGRNMVYLGSCLYIVCKDSEGRYTQLFRSVSGRPLDFVVAIDTAGDKIAASTGTTANVPHTVSHEEITCLQSMGTETTSLFVGTKFKGYLVQPRVDSNGTLVDTVYGEPTFKNIPFLDSGVVGQFATADINGDTAFVDFEGIKSFNAVKQLLLEGNSEEFSSIISPEFDGIKQDFCCAVTFGGDTLFAVKTLDYGYCIVVYDNNLGKFVSFDTTIITSPILQFAITVNELQKKLYAITASKVYQIYGLNDPASCSVKTKEWCTNNPKVEIRPSTFRAVFTLPRKSGNITVIPYYDLQQASRKTKSITFVAGGVNFPVQPPVGPNNKDRVENITVELTDGTKSCWKASMVINWENGADLTHYMLMTSEAGQQQTIQQQTKI